MENLITSRENKVFKDLLRLTQKKYRRELGLCIVEGEKIVMEHAKDAIQIFVREDKIEEKKNLEVASGKLGGVFMLAEKLWREVSVLENSSGAMAVVKIPKANTISFPYLVLDGVQDPGNVGTLLRTAMAFGFKTVFCMGSADVWSPKVIRASSGVQFGMNVIEGAFEKPEGSVLIGADVKGRHIGELQSSIDKAARYGLALGSEGRGLSDDVKKLVDENIRIDMDNTVESLNVAVAGGILMWSLRR